MTTQPFSVLASVTLAVLLIVCTALPARGADETAPSPCGASFIVSGSFAHWRTPAGVAISDAEYPERYKEAIAGKDFTAEVPGLPEGKYAIEISLAEMEFKKAGERIMEVQYNGQPLAPPVDIFATVGFARRYAMKATVSHPGDAVSGPLALRFHGVKGRALFYIIDVRPVPNESGEKVACVRAGDLAPRDWGPLAVVPQVAAPVLYTDPAQPLERRVDDLIRRMSPQEKVQQLMNAAPAIARLNLPAWDYWNECLHGVARRGVATVFPQAIGLAAAWDPDLMRQVGDTIATEARALYNADRASGRSDVTRYHGLTFWTPNINIFRDPRWGRGQETYGEDPWLTSRLAVNFIQGLQGNDPKYIKALACAKHFAVHSGPERGRNAFNATPPARDLYETYLPQFEAAVREANVGCVMSAYNALDGVPCSADPWLLTRLLRGQWGFTGYVVSDCSAITNIWNYHKFKPTRELGAAAALQAGCDLECGIGYAGLSGALQQHLIKEADLDAALRRVLAGRFRLGLFDPQDLVPFNKIPPSENASPAHTALALQAARESIVLLKNDGVLPLDATRLKRIVVLGPNADSTVTLVGNYHGTPAAPVTLLEGIRAAAPGAQIETARGCPFAWKLGETTASTQNEIDDAVRLAHGADVVIVASGLDERIEGEEMRTRMQGFDSGDRDAIELPGPQTALLRALHAAGCRVVLVNCSGAAMAMPWAAENIPAIVQAWYPGEQGGTAVADVLFGKVNPSGRLPVTFYRATSDLPAFTDYRMANRTYRYFTGKPLYPFGHGLSYTQFEYTKLEAAQKNIGAKGALKIGITIKNAGARDGDEVVQIYLHHLNPRAPQAQHALAAFQRIHLAAGAGQRVELTIPASAARYWDDAAKAYRVDPGDYELQAGASSGDLRQKLTFHID